MSELRQIEVGVLNITTHPDSPEQYLDIFNKLLVSERSVPYRGSDFLTLGNFGPIYQNKTGIDGIWGVFFIYVNIDRTGPVLDMRDRKPIISEEGEITFPAPEHLKPNLRMFNFAFFPKWHRLFFQTKTTPLGIFKSSNVSPSIFAGGLFRLLNSFEMISEYGEINVYPEKQVEKIADILRIPNITKLDIALTLPNDDDLSQEEERITERYKREKIKKVNYEMTGYKEDGLEPDIETQAMMRLAASNGKVTAVGYRGEQKLRISTSDHPVIEQELYYPTIESPLQLIVRVARNTIEKFTGKSEN